MKTLNQKFFIDPGDYRKTVFLAGTGRSGTTWVGDLINVRNHYRVLFEPFHREKINTLAQFAYFQYLRPENQEPCFLKPVRSILSGNVRHEWVDRFNKKFLVRKRLIKEIRANLMLKWIKVHFPEIPVILLLRHPCAVANSRIKLGWEPKPVRYLQQHDLVEDFLSPFRSMIERTTDTFEKHILVWCIQYLVPLKQFQDGEVLILFYEDLCVQPEMELKRLFDFIAEPFPPEVVEMVQKPSALARKHSAIISGDDVVKTWQKDITQDQAEKAAEILGVFGLSGIYGKEPMPLLDAKSVLTV